MVHKDLKWFQNLSTAQNKSGFNVVLLSVGSCGKEKKIPVVDFQGWNIAKNDGH
jgi:hypothetical protein